MTEEQRFFIQVLSDHLHNKATEAPQTNVNWSAIARLGRAHQVDGIVYYQCRSFMPEEQKAFCYAGYSEAVFYYANRITAMKEIGDTLHAAGIQYYTIKGLDVARFYPVPSLRTMGDCDIVVRQKDVAAAKQALRGTGYDGPDSESGYDWCFDKGKLHFELHSQIVKAGDYATEKQMQFFRDLTPYVCDSALDENYQYLFVLMHMRNHFMRKGIGLRQFLDVAVMIRNNPGLDWSLIEDILDAIELKDFAHACYSCIEKWFDIVAPVQFTRLEADARIFVTEQILANGVFGFNNQKSNSYGSKNALIMDKRPRWIPRLVMLLSSVFPGYAIMIRYPGCGFLNGGKYLLPLAWLSRFLYLLRRGDYEQAKNTIHKSLIPEEELQEREKYLKTMGLFFEESERE